MHVTQVLDKHLRRYCQGTHQKRMDAVISMVDALLRGRVLTVTGLGRALCGSSTPKHHIKKADRLIGNHHLHSERNTFYEALTHLTVGKQKNPVILVDWSDVSDDRLFQKIRASMAVEGRALTLYEEVHPQSRATSPIVQSRFLGVLGSLLPEGCRPIIVTDAGFKNPWFKSVKAMGWDFVGRVGGHTLYREDKSDAGWVRVESLFSEATRQAKYLGQIEVARANPLACHAYSLKKKPVGRVKKTRFGKKCAMKHSLKNAHRERTPWLLVTSLEGGGAITDRIIRIYQSRMQIEEAFRDMKNHRFGFSFRDSLTRIRYRMENLLLIGALATFSAWLVGKIAEMKGVHRQYQANTIKSRNVLSTFYLGLEVIARMSSQLKKVEFEMAMASLRSDRYAL